MKVLVIGASGRLGAAAASALSQHHEVIEASRSGEVQVDLSDTASIASMFERIGRVDAVIACTGAVPFKPLAGLSPDDFRAGINDKVLGQVNLVQTGTPYVNDGGSFTLTTGVLAREPIVTGVVASLANGALESFVMAAAAELPRGIRINAVSPSVLEEATDYHSYFPGFVRISSEDAGQAYVKSVDGIQTGRVIPLG
ncbi:short chain dehydrogenase [Pseudarthrobacter raffinosi]|uniref:short chain dehydrogenase n=1 Tax=Pseudarthrobacter raffinosi TaxID=2953651 RepID=UPI00208FEE70|nr:short chain dehydrogenase [Pseudarthrobacter sp. MDT3-9]MCO4252084.1 short chain dehydrogenase [Pseudarthrobacter sp. MDT3-9]